MKKGELVRASIDTTVFAQMSDWSPQAIVKAGTFGLVTWVSSSLTGAGRLWHKLFIPVHGTAWVTQYDGWEVVILPLP